MGFPKEVCQFSPMVCQEQFHTYQGILILLDRAWPVIACEEIENIPLSSDPADLACLIYTSGSTGQPKGVQITQKNLAHAIDAFLSYFTDPVLCYFLSPSVVFDAFLGGMFWTLCSGGKLLLPNEEVIRDPLLILQQIERYGVSHLDVTPSLYALLLEQAHQSHLETISVVIVAGEACTQGLAQKHFQRLPSATLYNLYGPTEATIWSTVYQCRSDLPATQIVPIGRPIANTSVYILDDWLQPVPIGVIGQLYIGGEGVARGYLNQPELTKDRFVQDPFDERPQARLYRSGDLARYLQDGTIEYHGRADQQVKLRGYRIELEEIEHVLSLHPGIQGAVVIVRDDPPQPGRLVAYVVASEPAPSRQELYRYLGQSLPEYMLPSALVFLAKLPQTPNHKVDRQALPAPEVGAAAPASCEEPHPGREVVIAGIWAEVLGLERVGRQENFFALGGHSLLAAQVMAQIERTFSTKLPLRTLVTAPTVAELAAHIEIPARYYAPWTSPLVSIQPGGIRKPLFCVHPIGGSVFCYAELASAVGPDQPVYGLQAPGFDGEQEPLTSIPQMAAAYLAAIKAHQPIGPYHLCGWSFGGMGAFEMARQLRQAGEQVASLILLDCWMPVLAEQRSEGPHQQGDTFLDFVADIAALFGEIMPDQMPGFPAGDTFPEPFLLADIRQKIPFLRDIDDAYIRNMYTIYTSNRQATGEYTPEVLRHPTTLFVAGEESDVRRRFLIQAWERLVGQNL